MLYTTTSMCPENNKLHLLRPCPTHDCISWFCGDHEAFLDDVCGLGLLHELCQTFVGLGIEDPGQRCGCNGRFEMLADGRHEAHVVLRDHMQEIEMSPEGTRKTKRIGRSGSGSFGKIGGDQE